MPTPTVVHDILDTYHHLPPCPVTGWDRTICGSYYDIQAAVQAHTGSAYTYSDIAGGLTWLHEHGPDECGVTINKIGPGRRKTMIIFDDVEENGVPRMIEIDGGVYMMLVDGVVLRNEQARVIKMGLIEWSDYRISSCRNDVIDIGLYRSNIGTSAPQDRRLRRKLQETANQLAQEITILQTMRSDLIASL